MTDEQPFYAAIEQVEEAAHAWSNAILMCRLYGHAWKPSTVTRNNRGYTVRQRCTRRCGCEREMLMDSRGYVVKRWALHYTDGYLLDKHTGRIGPDGKAVMRIVSLRHLTVIEGDDE